MKGSQRERLDFPILLDDKHISVITDIGYLRMDTPVTHSNQISSPAIIIVIIFAFIASFFSWKWSMVDDIVHYTFSIY